ncbi:MAG: four helix bundle protein [Anaerolineales bacterium]
MSPILRHFELNVYQLAHDGALLIFDISESFDVDQESLLVDRLRRSSRAVYSGIADAWKHRLYEAAFSSKLIGAEAMAAETQTWLRFATERGYLQRNRSNHLLALYDKIIDEIIQMITDPDPWLLP